MDVFIWSKSRFVNFVFKSESLLKNIWKSKNFDERFQDIKWDIYHTDLPFNPSALSLYKWAPIADELKTLDRKIVLNSMILKWDVIKQEFKNLIQF